MSWGSRSRLPERAITTVQAPGDRKNPSVLWLKYDFNINKTGIFAIHFYFLYFSNANDDHDIFFNSRIRFLVLSRLVPHIDSVYIPELGDFENIFYLYLKMNRRQ